MERGSDKVSPRVDDELKHELQSLLQSGTHESHVEAWKEQEPSGEDQPDVDAFGPDEHSANLRDASDDEVEARGRLARYLTLSSFPMIRELVIDEAQRNQAPDDVVAELRRLPSGREFRDVVDVANALAGPDAAR